MRQMPYLHLSRHALQLDMKGAVNGVKACFDHVNFRFRKR